MVLQHAPVALLLQSSVLPAHFAPSAVSQNLANSVTQSCWFASVATIVAIRETPPSLAPEKNRDQ